MLVIPDACWIFLMHAGYSSVLCNNCWTTSSESKINYQWLNILTKKTLLKSRKLLMKLWCIAKLACINLSLSSVLRKYDLKCASKNAFTLNFFSRKYDPSKKANLLAVSLLISAYAAREGIFKIPVNTYRYTYLDKITYLNKVQKCDIVKLPDKTFKKWLARLLSLCLWFP